jgi:preprotein translocase subunit SecG
MSILINILTIFEVIVCILLSLLVLMQRPRQEGLGAAFGSGMTDQMFGAQTTNVLQRGSVYLGVALFVLTFVLAILTSHLDNRDAKGKSLIDSKDKKAVPTTPVEPKKEDKPATAPATTPAPATTTPAAEKPADTKPAATPEPAPVTKPAESPAAPAGALPVPESLPTPPPAPELPK